MKLNILVDSGKINVLRTFLGELRSMDKLSYDITPTTNGYSISSGNRLVTSQNINKTIMAPTDARIGKLGRNYLESRRLTKKQWTRFKQAIESLKVLGATVKDADGVVYMDSGVLVKQLEDPKSYPIEMKGE
jgi:hypothetical protein